MSEGILNEVVEEIEIPVEETTETQPSVEETEIPVEETEVVEVVVSEKQNPFCVVSKDGYGEYSVHDIQTNSSWSMNPYGESYAVVPDEIVLEIMETKGFCDIELNEDGTEIVSFTAREIPVIETPEPKATQLDLIEAQVAYTAMMTDTLLEV